MRLAMIFARIRKQKHLLRQLAEDARELGLTYGVYASVMIAQAILESGSGSEWPCFSSVL